MASSDPRSPRHFILGTAGHVDHGKTELVKALTGHDTDRLKEEKERGISIELGFAPLPLAPDVFVGVVDVPGHERFVRQMVAGAGGIDLAMLLVAADEGVMPQTEEHVEVLRSLGVESGLVVISKSDLATADTLAIVREETATLVRGTFLEKAPVVPVSARTRDGLDALRENLLTLTRALVGRVSSGPFRLAIDRVFHQKGIGVVVTGSCYSGRVRVGDELALLPAARSVRVRDLESFGEKREEGAAGERLAIALHGTKLDEVARGDMLATPGRFGVTRLLDARVAMGAFAGRPLKNRERVRIHHGAREVLGRVVLLEVDELAAGATSLAQLRLEAPLVASAGDRVVLRSYSPARVVGGGVVVDAAPEVHRRSDTAALERVRHQERGEPASVLAQAVARAGANGIAESDANADLATALADRGVLVAIAGRWFHRDALDDLAARAIEIASKHTSRHALQWGVDKEELRRRLSFPHGPAVFHRVLEELASSHALFVREDRVRAGSPEHAIAPALARSLSSLNDTVRAAGVAFPTREESERAWSGTEPFAEAARWLRDAGEWVDVGTGWMHREALARSIEAARLLLSRQPAISVADFKDALGITRKHAIPLLEYFDRQRLTVRRGDLRLPGPGLASPRSPHLPPENL
ncbi:MAG TPA: selenocysteine-specific translation elongation factor [Candidatus Krumholzibacteria bacterium]|nr:selenocysteine-specific translation elongation factor [Candidatus Krumholzibacteria bacterium]